MKIIQASSLTPQQKAQYAQILAQATLTNPLYVVEDAPDDGDGQSDKSSSEQMLVNGTTEDSGSSSDAGGATPVGEQPATSQNDASSSSSQSSSSSSSGDSGEDSSEDASESKAYEISKSSPAKVVGADSSMPIVVIIAIIALIAIFLIGYIKNNDDEY